MNLIIRRGEQYLRAEAHDNSWVAEVHGNTFVVRNQHTHQRTFVTALSHQDARDLLNTEIDRFWEGYHATRV